MARGYIFEVCDTQDRIGELTEYDMSEYLSELGVDYVKQLDEEQLKQVKMEVTANLALQGAEAGCDEGLFYAVLSDDVKNAYFKSRFEMFKKTTRDMTLEQFSGAAQGGSWGVTDELRSLICYDYSDMVYSDGEYAAFDSFVRNAAPGKKYYFGNVLLLH